MPLSIEGTPVVESDPFSPGGREPFHVRVVDRATSLANGWIPTMDRDAEESTAAVEALLGSALLLASLLASTRPRGTWRFLCGSL